MLPEHKMYIARTFFEASDSGNTYIENSRKAANIRAFFLEIRTTFLSHAGSHHSIALYQEKLPSISWFIYTRTAFTGEFGFPTIRYCDSQLHVVSILEGLPVNYYIGVRKGMKRVPEIITKMKIQGNVIIKTVLKKATALYLLQCVVTQNVERSYFIQQSASSDVIVITESLTLIYHCIFVLYFVR